MARHDPVLELRGAQPEFEASRLPNVPLDLRLMPGDCVLIETHDAERAVSLADLCSGLLGLRKGEARCMGYDWRTLAADRAAALRGRIGRIHQRGAWSSMLATHVSIMLPQLHHTRTPDAAITQAALDIAATLGLPGLPMIRPDQLSEGDLIRAACVRAFLGRPRLLLLETSISLDHPELIAPILELLSRAQEQGAAAICFSRDVALWQAQAFPLTHCLTLLEDGLIPRRGV